MLQKVRRSWARKMNVMSAMFGEMNIKIISCITLLELLLEDI